MTGFNIPKNFGYSQQVCIDKEEKGPQFVVNWVTLDGGAKLFWLSPLGPKQNAKTFKMTLRVRACKDSTRFLLECTRECVPCDMSHQDMKRDMDGIFVSKNVVKEAAEGNGQIYYEFTIEKV